MDRRPFWIASRKQRPIAITLPIGLPWIAGIGRAPEQVAAGFLEIANANMAEAIRKVSVARGYDVREYTLVVFGGAAGQHACAIARRLEGVEQARGGIHDTRCQAAPFPPVDQLLEVRDLEVLL